MTTTSITICVVSPDGAATGSGGAATGSGSGSGGAATGSGTCSTTTGADFISLALGTAYSSP